MTHLQGGDEELTVIRRPPDSVEMHVRGDFDGHIPAAMFKDALANALDEGDVRVVAVTLDEVARLTNEGIGVLLQVWRDTTESGRRFLVEGAAGQVREKLVQMGVLRLFTSD